MKRPLPLFDHPDLEPARRMLEAITPHVLDGSAFVAFMRSWSEARDQLVPKLDGTEMAAGYRVISRAVSVAALMAICRSWDTMENARSFPNLAELLVRDQARSAIPEHRHEDLDGLIAEIRVFRNSRQLLALRVSRAEGFAHNLAVARDRNRMGDDAGPAIYNDIYAANDLSKHILQRCHLHLHGYGGDVAEWEADHVRVLRQLVADIRNYNAENGG